MSRFAQGVLSRLPAAATAPLQRAKLMALLQRERFSRQQRRTNALISVPGLPRMRRRPGSVWGVCLARNEEDIIAHTVGHMIAQGLDGVIVVDNLSTDGTRNALERLAAAQPRVHVGTDRQIGFRQGGKVSYLAHLAWRAGADWVVPFDADEFWFAEGRSVASFLAQQTGDSVWCDFRNVYPTVEDGRIDLASGHPVQVERREREWLRICFRARRWPWVGEGNHALRDGRELPARGLHMLHYSYRSLEQYSGKVDHGVAALRAAGMDVSIATHWRRWAALSQREREELWDRQLEGEGEWSGGEPSQTERVTIADPTRWESWDPQRALS